MLAEKTLQEKFDSQKSVSKKSSGSLGATHGITRPNKALEFTMLLLNVV